MIKTGENTGKFRHEGNRDPKWYVALEDRWIGPMAAAEVVEKIQRQEITWVHYVWKNGQTDWKRICDLKEFQIFQPHQPPKSMKIEVKSAAAPTIRKASGGRGAASVPSRIAPKMPPKIPGEKTWYLHYNDSQFGPFSTDEVSRYLRIGKLHGGVFCWKEGLKDWSRLKDLPEFEAAVEESARAPKKKEDQRKGPRRPMVARILLANQDSVIVGVCRDISIGGMQVLTDRIPGQSGSRIKMNVSPGKDGIKPFVAEGVIVRILEDGLGFSFRFEKLSDDAKRSIAQYIAISERA